MTALVRDNSLATQTSAMGSMFDGGSAPGDVLDVLVVRGRPLWPTESTPYRIIMPSQRTAAGPAGKIDSLPTESTAEAVMEIRRRSGLTWEELSDLFDVSRRSVHHWASGKPVSATHDRAIRRILAALDRLDRGEANATRALLLARGSDGVSALDLLKDGLIDEAAERAAGEPPTAAPRRPLSREVAASRRPPSPALLLEARQDRPEEPPSKARVVEAVRTPRKKG